MMKRHAIGRGLQAFIRLFLILLLLAISLSFALMQGGFVSWFIFFMFLPFALYSTLLFFWPFRFSAERTSIKKQAVQGESLIVETTIKRMFRFPLLYVIAEEKAAEGALPIKEEDTRQVTMLGTKKSFVFAYEATELRRGYYEQTGIELTVTDFFGWMKRKVFVSSPLTIVVTPKITEMKYTSPSLQNKSSTGSSNLSSKRDHTVVSGVRDYQPGDRMSWIHWKTFAKTQTLQTKTFESQQSKEWCLILDGTQEELFEEQVEFCASILAAAVKKRETLSFLFAGAKQVFIQGIHTNDQLKQALYKMAQLQPEPIEQFEKSLPEHRLLENNSGIYFVTSNLSKEWAQVLQRTSKQSGPAVCFLLRPLEDSVEKIGGLIDQSICIVPLTPSQFPNAFMEVMKP